MCNSCDSGKPKSADEARRIAGEKFALSLMEEWASTGVDPDQGPDDGGRPADPPARDLPEQAEHPEQTSPETPPLTPPVQLVQDVQADSLRRDGAKADPPGPDGEGG